MARTIRPLRSHTSSRTAGRTADPISGVTSHLAKLDRIGRDVILTDGTAIPVDDLFEVDGSLWDMFED